MNVLSLFDGISCGRIALERAGIHVDRYAAYEIDENAIQMSQNNYPDIERYGSVVGADFSQFRGFDILMGGFPCQDLSINKANRQGLHGSRSGLFWELVGALDEVSPKYFLVENNYKMPKQDEDMITKTLGVSPIMIDSSLVSGQKRKRLYWTNIPDVQIPLNKHIYVKDICTYDNREDLCSVTKFNNFANRTDVCDKPLRIGQIGSGGQGERVYSIYGKSVTLTANGGGRGAKTGLYLINNRVRKLTPLEAERLQTLPDNYTSRFSDTTRLKAVGNGWTVDVIAHILKSIPEEKGE